MKEKKEKPLVKAASDESMSESKVRAFNYIITDNTRNIKRRVG